MTSLYSDTWCDASGSCLSEAAGRDMSRDLFIGTYCLLSEEPKARYASPAPKFETRVAESRTPSKGREFSPLITRPTRELTPEGTD